MNKVAAVLASDQRSRGLVRDPDGHEQGASPGQFDQPRFAAKTAIAKRTDEIVDRNH